jgi:O-antigen/teichoic acid export membrane protein
MQLRRNIVANYLGQGWSALMGLAFVPFYIRYLGMETYGLIGIFVLLQTLLALLDLGLTPALSLEVSRYKAGAHEIGFIRDLVRSVEVIALGIGLGIIAAGWLSADWIASDWLNTARLSHAEVARAIVIMGIVIALRFLENVPRSCLIGLQEQVLLNLITSVAATVRGAGAVLVLAWVSPTISAFFVWQGIVSALTALAMIVALYRLVPITVRLATFSSKALRSVWRFAGGMLLLAVLSLLLTQMDKIILSKLISLEQFGYYSLAVTVANLLYMVVMPISQAYYPHFSALLVQNDVEGLVHSYHKAAQTISVVAGSLAFLLIAFGDHVVFLWTGDLAIAQRVGPLVCALALGTLLNALLWIPHQMQLAHGITRIAVRTNLVAVMVVVPALLWITPLFGALGAAWVWVALNTGYLLFNAHLMYRRVLQSQRSAWYFQDVGLPMLALSVVAAICERIFRAPSTATWTFVTLATVLSALLAASSLAAPAVRAWLKSAPVLTSRTSKHSAHP